MEITDYPDGRLQQPRREDEEQTNAVHRRRRRKTRVPELRGAEFGDGEVLHQLRHIAGAACESR